MTGAELVTENGSCPEWCHGGHPGFPEHISSGWMCYVALSMEDPYVFDMGPSETPNHVPFPQELEIYLELGPGGVGPCVVIGRMPTGNPRISCLPEEALHLGQALIRLATMAGHGARPVRCGGCGPS